MGKLEGLILKISLGIFAVVNFVACIVTTEVKVLLPLNLLVAVACLGMVAFLESRASALARERGISRKDARRLIGDYFAYYHNVARIPLDEYLERRQQEGTAGTGN